MNNETTKIVLQHPDLVIELYNDKHNKPRYIGRSKRYKPYEASASTAIACFFSFHIQLSEQKQIALLLDA